MTRPNRKPIVYFANSYQMRVVHRLWRDGRFPENHLWGATALEAAGYDVRYSAFGANSSALERLSKLIKFRAGNLAQAVEAVRSRADVLYAGDPRCLKLFGLVRHMPPVVALMHPVAPAPSSRLARRAAARYQEVICLSRHVYDQVLQIPGRTPGNTSVLPWGPDLDFSGYRGREAGNVVVSVGRSGRDYATLQTAAQLADVELVIGPDLTFDQALSELRRAAVIAIPLEHPERMHGITELNDALALAKPVVMTRSPFARDVDIEGIGCGIWVDPGDVDGWRRTLSNLANDAGLRDEMGSAGRQFAEREWNHERFGEGLVDIVARVVPSN